MCYLDEAVMYKMYPWHPVISVNTASGIAGEIGKLYFDPSYARQKASDSRRWAEEFHSSEKAGKTYARQIQEILDERK